MKIVLLISLAIYSCLADSYGALLFNGNCVTCHKVGQAISAPSINEVQENYLRAFPDKKDFVDYMTIWVLDPKEETSIMQGAIHKYELMPTLAYDEQTLREIAAYIYETKF